MVAYFTIPQSLVRIEAIPNNFQPHNPNLTIKHISISSTPLSTTKLILIAIYISSRLLTMNLF
jgi:hypothetical protein